MVLTDEQMNDLELWIRRRSALHRYVEGWGVVAGLAVRCDPHHPRRVLVGPGYARSCCGDDIVTCEDIAVDVCACEPKGSCDPGAPAPAGERAVDLYLRYTETWEDPATVRASCGCGAHDSVQYARITEGGTVACVPVADRRTNPATLAALEWNRGYLACAAVVHDYLREVSDEADADDQLKWLLAWIDRHDKDEVLCCVRRHLCADGLGEAGASGALLEIVYALRGRYIAATYGECHRPDGVLLARVWLRDDGEGHCAVDCVDASPPFRRDLASPGWPELPGHVNVAPLIWQRRAVAGDRARQLGVRLRWHSYHSPEEVSHLARLFDEDSAYVPTDVECEALLYRDRCGHRTDPEHEGRVVQLRRREG
jgi:hypothetical protein